MNQIRTFVEQIAPISDAAWSAVQEFMTLKEFPKGAFLARRGRIEHQFGIVLEGILRAYTIDESGREYIKTFFTPIHFSRPISFVGVYASLTTKAVNQLDIETLTPTKIWMGDYRNWEGLYPKFPELESWSRRLAELFFMSKQQKELELVSLQADVRYEIFKSHYPELEQLIPQYYIAQYLGISSTQLSRIRKNLAQS